MMYLPQACRNSVDSVEIWRRFKLVAGVLYIATLSQSLSAAAPETTNRMMALDAEIQAIKEESLAIRLMLPPTTTSRSANESVQSFDPAVDEHNRQNYLAVIERLQRQEMHGSLSDEDRLLLARLKLAYGLDLEAGFDLHAVGSEGVAVEERSRAWYDLATSFHLKGYYRAALQALGSAQDGLPADLRGPYQLLQANLFMSLGDFREAARSLTPWRGDKTLAPYGQYNLALAKIRTGEPDAAKRTLEAVTDTRGTSEEIASLRDRARLSLSYLLAREGEHDRARKQLKAVRSAGPYANRAMFALGWIAYQEGHRDSAIALWVAAQSGSTADPIVLESLLLVPALNHQENDLAQASRNYERAMRTFTRELKELDTARRHVLAGKVVPLLLRGDQIDADPETLELLGPLLASRDLQILRRDHGDLRVLREELDRKLREVDALAAAEAPEVIALPEAQMPAPKAEGKRPPGSPQRGVESLPDGQGGKIFPEASRQWWGQSYPTPRPGTQTLPEIESPPRRTVKPLPGSPYEEPYRPTFKGLPQTAQWLKEPPDPTIFGMPDSKIIWLPESGEFFRRPGQIDEEDYAYPDELPRVGSNRRVRSGLFLPGPEVSSPFDASATPVEGPLRDLALDINQGAGRRQPMVHSFDPGVTGEEREQQIEALRQRIKELRTRVSQAVVHFEEYTRALALEELDYRQGVLETMQEQASLELAKTYDQLSQQ